MLARRTRSSNAAIVPASINEIGEGPGEEGDRAFEDGRFIGILMMA